MLPVDKLTSAEIYDLQNTKLKELLAYVNLRSPFYKSLFEKKDIDISKIETIEDLKFLPTTTKEDLQLQNMAFLCVPKSEITEYTSTSGTLGAPVTIALTTSDLSRLAYNEYLSFTGTGATSADIFQLALTLDKQFMAGMAYYQGAARLKAGVVRTGPGAPSMQWETIFRVNSTAMVVVPSFILKLIEYAQDNGIDYRNSPMKRAICIGENVRTDNFELNTIGKRIKEFWDIELFSTYASTEMQTAFTECAFGKGGHIHPELLIAEVVDDEGNPLPFGEKGELTVTTLGVEGMPLVRYRTGDICTLVNQPCECGRQTLRISPILGRKQQMIKFKGTSLYPSVIYEILNSNSDIIDYVLEVSSNELDTDDILIWIAVKEPSEKLLAQLTSYLHASLRVMPKIIFADISEIHKKQQGGIGRKPLRFVDRRTNKENWVIL
ncbi:MAG: AMP-binding protein [Bacteroidales bacterium]|nr:AMP-binding protein [Bacteroidales bacterium]